MLYVTTRCKADSYTDHHTLISDIAPNGGFFLPLHIPKLDPVQRRSIKEQSFGQTVALILNLFYNGRITPWDVDCCIGKVPAKVIPINQRVFLAKLWDNPAGEYSYLCKQIFAKLCPEVISEPTQWASIAIRIAVLFGLCGILEKAQIKNFDICVSADNFSDIMAAWYARSMGLPARKIICSCSDNSALWDLLHRGEMNTSVLLSDNCDLAEIEQLVFAALGYDQAQNFIEVSRQKGVYRLSPEQLTQLNEGMFVSVVGKDRAESVISSLNAANNIVLDSCSALSLGGLQDFRSRTGENAPALVLWDRSPF